MGGITEAEVGYAIFRHIKKKHIPISDNKMIELTIFITAEGLTATPLKYRGSSFHGDALRSSSSLASSNVYRASAAAILVGAEEEEDASVAAFSAMI